MHTDRLRFPLIFARPVLENANVKREQCESLVVMLSQKFDANVDVTCEQGLTKMWL